MNEQAKRWAIWPAVALAYIALFMFSFNLTRSWPTWAKITGVAFAIGSTLWVRHRDRMRRLSVLFFEPDAATIGTYSAVVAGAEVSPAIRKLRHVLETATYANGKYEAGASQGVRLGVSTVSVGQAPGVLANIDVPLLTSGRTTLAFYPDRVLAFQGKSVGAVSYKALTIESFACQFIEHEAVPADATVVGQTWQYVNKKGGPDRRFKNNKQMPICRYNRLHIASSLGLDIRLLSSRDGAFDDFARAVTRLAKSSA